MRSEEMNVVIVMLALIAVGCFIAHGIGWRRGLGFGLAAATAALLLVPPIAALLES